MLDESATEAREEPKEELANPLLTPREQEALRAARELRERSQRLTEHAAQVTRPKDFIHRFPPAAEG